MKKFTLTVFEPQRNQILSALGFCGINEFAIKKNSAPTIDKIDVSISCEPIKLFEIGMRFQFEVQESISMAKKPTA